ncbi:unnamed protein product [Mytilus coruscus]|uniref:Uncharacterized protein n=1 Tax=Mytilus coruscus TaxID=42192 RepID=A0A6J8CUE1_MYTCO|nr:unnamed protein product [Mytilus coruscus]
MVQSEIRTVEEQRRAKAEELSRQGSWMKWNLPERKITWAELWMMEPFRISFMLRAVYDTLHSPQNLHQWGLIGEPSCKLCGEREKKEETIKNRGKADQIRQRGRYGICNKVTTALHLGQGSEWNIRADIGKKLVFPECVQTTLRSDIVVWSQSSKMIVAIELTVPWEERCEKAYQRKKEKYTELMTTCSERGWKAWLVRVAAGCRGFPAQSV